MRYLVISGLPSADLPRGCRLVADGEVVSLEQPWSFGAPLIAQVDDGADLAALKAKPGVTGFTVEGLLPPGEGQAFAIGAHPHPRCGSVQALYRARARRYRAPWLPLHRARRRGNGDLRRVYARAPSADRVPRRRRRSLVLFLGSLCASPTYPPHRHRAAFCPADALRPAAGTRAARDQRTPRQGLAAKNRL